MATVVKRGKASVEGVVATIDVIVYPLAQSISLTQDFQEEIIQDEHGFDAAWLARNEKYEFEIGMKIVGDTTAHAKSGGAFLSPLATVTISGCDLTVLNGAYQNVSGSKIDLGNNKVGDISFKLRRYADSTQNTLATTTPS